jgi:ABC-type lipoprotein release transport system permease subunit
MVIVRLGWRNLWRNTRRSLITVSGVAFAFAFLIVLLGFSRGVMLQLLRNGTELMVGHLQVHDHAYLPDRSIYDTIGGATGADWQAAVARIRQRPSVRHAAPRVYGFGLFSTGNRSAGGQIVGVVAADERGLNRLVTDEVAAALVRGHSLALGAQLASDIGAKVGDEVAVITPAADGTQGNVLVHITAILRTGLPALDRSLAVMRLDDVQALLALEPGRIHEIAITLDDPMTAPAIGQKLAQELAQVGGLLAGTDVEHWRVLLPQLSDYLDAAGAVNTIIIGLVVAFASVSLLNAMAMATFERTHEFGVLNALGMKPRLIVATVLAESLCLVALGLVGGLLLGTPPMTWLTTHGVNLSWLTGGLAVFDSRIDPIIKGVWDWQTIPRAASSLAVATVTAAYWPARRATRVDAVEALRAPVIQ